MSPGQSSQCANGLHRSSMIWHPESAGRAHIVGMIDGFITKLKARQNAATDGEITFETMESVARSWKNRG